MVDRMADLPATCVNRQGFGSRGLLCATQAHQRASFALISGSGVKSYQDDTLPISIDGATYILTAQRGNVQRQASMQLTVTFGSGRPGAMRLGFAENSGAAAVSK